MQEMLDWYRQVDAGDLRRNALNESGENMTALNALQGDIWNPRVMDLSMFKVGGWNTGQTSNQIFLEEFIYG